MGGAVSDNAPSRQVVAFFSIEIASLLFNWQAAPRFISSGAI
jgi:hypothetical protein